MTTGTLKCILCITKNGFVDLLKAELSQGVRTKTKWSIKRIQMHGLSGDRFLRRFAGILKRRWSRQPAEAEEKPEAEEEKVVGSNSHAAEEAPGKEGTGAVDK